MEIRRILIYTVAVLVVIGMATAAIFYFVDDDVFQAEEARPKFEPPELSDNPPMSGDGIDQIYKDMEKTQ